MSALRAAYVRGHGNRIPRIPCSDRRTSCRCREPHTRTPASMRSGGVRPGICDAARGTSKVVGILQPGGLPQGRGMTNFTSTTEQANQWSGSRPASRDAERAWEPATDAVPVQPSQLVTPSRTPRPTRAKAAAVFEYTFTRRRIAEPVGTVRSPDDVAALLAVYVRPDEAEQERLAVAILDVKNHVIGVETVYVGNTTGSPVRVGEVFRSAVRLNAAAIVIAHNHPSGDPSPSGDDIRLTGELASAGRVLDIDVLDHVVLGGDGRIASMRALGHLG